MVGFQWCIWSHLNHLVSSKQDVISQNKFLRQHHSSSSISSTSTMGPGGNLPPGGIRGLSKASHDKLQAYQHLFYLLQTQPNYLAKLMFELPQSKTTKFMESAILSLFNYASNQRDEYMLIGLFKTALEEEIKWVNGFYKLGIINFVLCY